MKEKVTRMECVRIIPPVVNFAEHTLLSNVDRFSCEFGVNPRKDYHKTESHHPVICTGIVNQQNHKQFDSRTKHVIMEHSPP